MIDYSKFLRNFALTVEANDGTSIGVTLPFTVEFDITRNTLQSSNVGSIRVFNLSQTHRNAIRKDVTNWGDLRRVSFKAGYGNNLSLAFDGTISQAWSVREGSNFITQIESLDAGFAYANGFTSANFAAGTAQTVVLSEIVNNMPGVTLGAIGKSFSGNIGSLGNTYDGNSCNLASELSNGQFFIDNGLAFFLADNECRAGKVAVIDASFGLLNTPVLEQNRLVTVEMLFEPRIVAGQLVTLQSVTGAQFNSNYKVVGIKHRGMISSAVCGDATTTLTLDNNGNNVQVITQR